MADTKVKEKALEYDAYYSQSSEGEEEEEEDDIGWHFEEETADFTKKYNAMKKGETQSNPNAARGTSHCSNNPLRKYENLINLGSYAPALSSSSLNALEGLCRKTESLRVRSKDKSDRATTEQVLDPRTRMILFKLLSRGLLSNISGCVSTGKEANVYYADSATGPCAVKVYKTSILIFKDRDRYVNGEYRFRHGYSRHNPRKMVRLWAEKEMRNLSRLHQNGIACPRPIILRGHVLVMSFLGSGGWPHPKLKDANITDKEARELYLECVLIIRKLFWSCKLVHADLSEYNMLYDTANGCLYIIDVSQSVEHDHPHALEFLRKDCTNVTEFFRKKGIAVMNVKSLFDFVTDGTVTVDNIDQYIEEAQKRAIEEKGTNEDQVDDAVFKNIYIPQSLHEVSRYESDVSEAQTGSKTDIAYQTITGLKPDLSGTLLVPQLLQNGEENKSDFNNVRDQEINDLYQESANVDQESGDDSSQISNTDDSSNDEESVSGDCWEEREKPSKEEISRQRKEHKETVKKEKREKRKNKIPKHIKKRKEKVARQKQSKK
ncbi:PREDICTED: serine/threonine-protein kinase RIO1-like isoform X1 [Amphimedon queenslandica]|uniref:Serine/threonine-protein kinase RIO1 n=1 Tax=Amphimedon queenslandica TaxID=400682 RepID=A0AAN0IN89_AMPQE|nr:PREDICTED: serine/threonine-protein kinase RIO1-like isoform X1 [Amphimedon queenslandica]|eukprot:XP_011405349.1 PREDICTED: serine/threonine-protein kinase RIO1-like isoform X1 [Amphimedon queenslandica]